MQKRDLQVGDVVQLAPGPDTFFGGCFMQVTEPKSWGAQGFVCIPEERGSPPGQAFFRAKFEDMEYVGKAEWISKSDD